MDDGSAKHSTNTNVNLSTGTTPYFHAKEAPPPPPYSEHQESHGSVPSSYSQSYHNRYGPTPPPGFQSYPVQTAPGPIRNYGTTTVLITQPSDIVFVGGCPACRVGVLEDDYTCLGIFCAIFFFPVGILCCLAFKDKRCSHCGAYFG